MEEYLMKNHRDYLVENELLLLAGSVQLNWNSQTQVLVLLKAVEPKLKSMAAEEVAKCLHPIFRDLEEYKDALKLITTYGEAFLEKHTEPDGMLRTNYNQIVSTGRVSSHNYNSQNIPSKEHLENRYRNAFIWKPGFTFVDGDYEGQELCCISSSNTLLGSSTRSVFQSMILLYCCLLISAKYIQSVAAYSTFSLFKIPSPKEV